MHTAQDGESAGSLSYETGALVRIDLTTYNRAGQGNHVFIPTFDDAVRVVFAVDGDRAASLVLHQEGQELQGIRVR